MFKIKFLFVELSLRVWNYIRDTSQCSKKVLSFAPLPPYLFCAPVTDLCVLLSSIVPILESSEVASNMYSAADVCVFLGDVIVLTPRD